MDLFENPKFFGERGLMRMDRGICLAVEAQEREEEGYCDALYECICSIAREQETVHIDDVLRRFTRKPAHPNANAGPWRRAKNDRIIQPSVHVRRCSADQLKNAHIYPVYLSLIYRSSHADRHA
jgi:hypothetical protein